jgi:hypothetical protein
LHTTQYTLHYVCTLGDLRSLLVVHGEEIVHVVLDSDLVYPCARRIQAICAAARSAATTPPHARIGCWRRSNTSPNLLAAAGSKRMRVRWLLAASCYREAAVADCCWWWWWWTGGNPCAGAEAVRQGM